MENKNFNQSGHTGFLVCVLTQVNMYVLCVEGLQKIKREKLVSEQLQLV